jgi:hypothetical protein
MTKRQTRAFFIGSTAVFSLIFIALTIDSHRQFGRLTNADQITPEVVAGKHVCWERAPTTRPISPGSPISGERRTCARSSPTRRASTTKSAIGGSCPTSSSRPRRSIS